MVKKVGDLVVVVGTYEKDGKTKKRYENIGIKFQNNDGGSFFTLKRTFNPAGVPNPDNRDSILVSVFEKKEDDTFTVTDPSQIAWKD